MLHKVAGGLKQTMHSKRLHRTWCQQNRRMITIITHPSTPQTSPISSRKPFSLPRRENWHSDRSSHRWCKHFPCVFLSLHLPQPPQDGGAFVIPIAQKWMLECRKCLAQGHQLLRSRINISSSACLVLKPHAFSITMCPSYMKQSPPLPSPLLPV